MKKYETYKDSGIQWWEEIPTHWDLKKAKHMFSLITENVSDSSLPKIALENIESWTGKYIETDSDFMGDGVEFKKDDILFGKLRPYLAKVYKAQFAGQAVGDIYVFRGNKEQIPEYLKYLLLSYPFISVVDGSTYGAKMPRANWDFISHLVLPCPPKTEQVTIAAYLDHKVGQIDATISEKEKMLEDLKAYRSAIISEAVTKGLDKNVEMKDSGIEWCREIPKHWNTNKLKFFADISTGTTPSTANDEYWKEAAENWYTPSDFKEGDIHLKESLRRVSSVAFEKSACRIFKKNVVLVVGIGATLGKVGISSVECSANQQINAIEFYDNVYPLFGAYYLSSLKEVMNSLASTATLAIMNQSITGSIPFVCPTLDEQKEIADYLEKKTESIGSLLNQIKTQVEELKSYRSTLITEAVTGKIDLRGWKPKVENV